MLADLSDLESGVLNACDTTAGDAWLKSGRADSAAPLFQRVVERYRADGDTLSQQYVIALGDNARTLFVAHRPREARAVMHQLLALSRNTADPWTRIATILNTALSTDALGEFETNRIFLGSIVGDSAGADSLAARAPVLRYEYARTLDWLGLTDSARHWTDLALTGEAELGPRFVVAAHLTAAQIALRQGDRDAFARHSAAVERVGQQTSTKAQRERGLLRLLTLTNDNGSLAVRIETELDTLGFGAGRPRQDLLVEHLLVAAERLNDSGYFVDAKRYAATAAELSPVDSLARKQSGVFGWAMVEVARAAAGLKDVSAAREALRAADAPLRFGLGSGHRLMKVAAMVQGSMER